MNTLSWLLYAADVAGNVAITAEVYVFFVILFYGLYRLGIGLHNTAERLDEGDEGYLKAWTSGPLTFLWFLCLAITMFVPDQRTIYMIAASEAGEYVATTDRAERIIDKIEQAINQQLETDTKE